VNAITSHHQVRQHPHQGVRGHLTATGGSANALGGGSAGFEYGHGAWLLWGGGGGQRTGDYHTPIGTIQNSHTRLAQTSAGGGHFGDRFFASLGYTLQDGKYGIPFAPGEGLAEEGPVDLKFSRHNLRLNTGINELNGALERFTQRELHGLAS
jgi:hypothetical protein